MRQRIVSLVVISVVIGLTALYADQIVVIDPGHGGPNGGKYGMNGDGYGTAGPNGLTEEWVNLQVALKLDTLFDEDYETFPKFVGVLTRDFDTTFRYLWERVQKAKDYDATYFLSVHHNGGPDTIQGSEVYWSDSSIVEWWPWQQKADIPDSTFYRSAESRDSLFAKKLLLRLDEGWHYGKPCFYRKFYPDSTKATMFGCDESDPCNSGRRLFVLNHTHHCYCALSEASYLTDYLEEALFDDEESGHADEEADALYTGTHSFYYGAGIAQISNRFIGGPGQTVGVDEIEYQSPVEFTWEPTEPHELAAWENFYYGGHAYTFHHWAHWEPGEAFPTETHESPDWSINVPWEEGFHIYRAYFSGGIYGLRLYPPHGQMVFAEGDTVNLTWGNCAVGVDSTTEIDICLDRHNGETGYPDTLARFLYCDDWLEWIATGPSCDSCRIKYSMRDIAGNEKEEESSWTFEVCDWLVGDADGDELVGISDAVYLIEFVFNGGPAPTPHPLGSGDVNCDDLVNLTDAVYIVQYVFNNGPPPACKCSHFLI